MRRVLVSVLTITALGIPVLGQAETWDIDPAHTSAQFAVRHMMVSTVRGEFGKVNGTVALDKQDLAKSSVEATIDTASINTRVSKRDDHLKSSDFFDVTTYPTITFKSKKIEAVGEGKFKVTGDLTLHGVTKETVLTVEGSPQPFKDLSGNLRIGGVASTKLNRKDFGLMWNKALETGGVVVGDEVDITIDVELTRKPNLADAADVVPATPAGLIKEATQIITGGSQ
jgi:polyisoprenoid-binding protein YceI